MVDDSDKPELKDPFDGLDSGEAAREEYFRNTDIFGDGEAPISGPAGIERLRLSAHFESALSEWDARARGDLLPITTPWDVLNDKLNGGFWPKQSIVLCAEPGSGKTQWAMQLAYHAAKQGHPVVMFQLEADASEVAARIGASIAKVSWSGILYGTASEGDREKVRSALSGLSSLPLYVDTPSPLDWFPDDKDTGIAARIKAASLAHPGHAPLVVLDYAQLAAMAKGGMGEARERIARVFRIAKEAARDAGGSLLVISAVSRENAGLLRKAGLEQTTASARDYIGVGRDTSEIEYSADVVMALCPRSDRETWLAVAKCRASGPSWVTFGFNGHRFDAA